MSRVACYCSLLAATVLATSCWRDTECSDATEASFTGPWEANNFSPETRLVKPRHVLSADGSLISDLTGNASFTLNQDTPLLVFDFGIEVGGIVELDYEIEGADWTSFGLAFTEAKEYIGKGSDSSRGGSGGRPSDGPLLANFTSQGHYVLPDERMRGGFRYLTLFLDDASEDVAVHIANIALEISFQPTWSNLRAYGGYFDSNDDLLNQIWYSGAYTVQTNSAPGNTATGPIKGDEKGWRNAEWITDGSTVLLDGAKRDRLVWIGDMGVAVPSAFVSTGELESTKYALLAIVENQNEDGMFPKAGPPYLNWNSDTYHLWTIIGMYNYFLFSGDINFIESHWSNFEKAIEYSKSLLNEDGIVSTKGEQDWGRITGSRERCSASGLLYRSLSDGARVARWLSRNDVAETYEADAEQLRSAIMEQFWDEEKGAFTDGPSNSTLYPQDGNSIALAYGVVKPCSEKANRVSDYLVSNWSEFGPEVPELPQNISPFISSIELEAHFRARRPERSLELMRSLWGWYLKHENGTQSTTPEGFLTNGTWGYRFNKGYSNGPAYMSHAHCWSSGPTSTLTEYMLGLRVTKPAGEEWRLQPASFKELDTVQAGFTTTLGKFSAKFTVEGSDVLVEWDTPTNTKGVVHLPGQDTFTVGGGKGNTTVPLT